jgi:hypothetical protein
MNRQSLMNLIRTAALAAMAAIPGMCCSYSVSVQTNPIPASGGPVQIYVSTQPGCQWELSHGGTFLSYYGGRTGTGSGYAYLYATANYGATRTAPVYALRPYTYQCGFGRSAQYCTSWTTASGATAVQP